MECFYTDLSYQAAGGILVGDPTIRLLPFKIMGGVFGCVFNFLKTRGTKFNALVANCIEF